MEYGTGAVFGCPAHDQRDLDFARKYMLATPRVVSPDGKDDRILNDEAYTGPGTIVNSDFLNGMDVEAAKAAVIARAEAKAGARARPFGGCATGASRASVTGARRSRSSIAMLRRGAGAERPAAGRAAR
jgi:hypothetical protein